jgi:L-alanine-DL-glutamate epimerase-like enolase superfamily enzyme
VSGKSPANGTRRNFVKTATLGGMANVHCTAATQNVLALEMPTQAVDNPWWEKLVRTTDVGQKTGVVPK